MVKRQTKFLVLLDDGTGLNAGHLYSTCTTRRKAERAAYKAEGVFPWCVGAWVKEVPLDCDHDPQIKGSGL